MAVHLTPFMTLANQYASLLQDWDGDLAVHTVHGAQKIRMVSAGDTLDITEIGVLISWRGDKPTGALIPWSEIASIEQAGPE